jgi:hypothetical protein
MNHRKCPRVSTIFFSVVVLVACSPITVRGGLIHSFTFEDGTFGNVNVRTSSPGGGKPPSLCCPPASLYPLYPDSSGHSAKIVNSPVRVGTKALRLELRPGDKGYQYSSFTEPYVRAELERGGINHIGKTLWYGFSIYVDPSWVDNSTDSNGTIVAQWHSPNDSCDIARGPHLGIRILRTLEWSVQNTSDPNACTTSASRTSVNFNLGPVTKGVWVDWVIYAKWSYGSDGELKIWKSGNLVINRNGPNTYNDQSEQLFKWGIYKSWWNREKPVNTFVLYYDEIKIGDASSRYEDVAPTRSPSSTPPAPTNLQVATP